MEKEIAFIDWLNNNGSSVSPKIQFSAFEEGRGIIAEDNIEQDEELFYIGLECCICPEIDDESDSMSWLSIIIALHQQFQHDSSFFEPYLSLMSQIDCPLVWSSFEQTLVEKISAIGKDKSAALFMEVNKHVSCTLEEFNFYACLVMAYSFTFGDNIMMVPMADMLNHHSSHNAQLYEVEDGFIMRAIKPIAAGQQVFNTYGDYSNIDLLIKYGFIEPNNPYEMDWLDSCFGLFTAVDEVYVEEQWEEKNGYDPRLEVEAYMVDLDLILDVVETNDRIIKLQYIAQTHKELLLEWLEQAK